ncbi:MAG: hypothetical protein AAB393_02310, partial [Bacteroidota bacterium]
MKSLTAESAEIAEKKTLLFVSLTCIFSALFATSAVNFLFAGFSTKLRGVTQMIQPVLVADVYFSPVIWMRKCRMN